jgi:periplasmic protein TonB
MNPRTLRLVALALLVALLIAGAVWLYTLFSQPDETPKKRAVQEIALLKPPPPPPPGPDLGVDAAGSGSGDSFGLVGKPGGSDLIGGTGGGGGDRFAWYGALLRERITDAILRDEKLRKAQDYQRVISVWVSASGAVTRVELVGAAQFPELDEALRNVLRGLPALREGAPGDMPQPIRLRVSARS